MRVYIQQKRGRFPNINYYNAWLGFEELGYETALLDEAGFASLEPDQGSMIVAEIPFMLAAFQKAGVKYSPLPYIPDELHSFAKRRIWKSTLGEARDSVVSGQSLFVKPLEGTPRYFKGQVLRVFRDLIKTSNCPSETLLWCSEIVDFVSEYRVFIQEGKFVGIQHYFGDFRRFVNWSTIDSIFEIYKRQPAGFAMDFGVTSDGQTLIVEQNDGFSLGSYGLHHVTYAKLLVTRWKQILGTTYPYIEAKV